MSEYKKMITTKPPSESFYDQKNFGKFLAPWWAIYDQIFVVSHTEIQARVFCKDNGVPRNKARFLVDIDRLRGVRGCLIVLLDGFTIGKTEKFIRELNIQKSLGRNEVINGQDFQKKS